MVLFLCSTKIATGCGLVRVEHRNRDQMKKTDHIQGTLKEQLEFSDGIKKHVIRCALEYSSPLDFFRDLLHHGCISGMVPDLIYYKDTHAFFDKHYYEIDELRIEYEQWQGRNLIINGDLKNTLAWFAFERVASELAFELNIT